MTTTRKINAIKALKKQIEMEKERLGPEKLKELQAMAQDIMKGNNNSVPYDKKSAMEALRLYIKNHEYPEKIEKQILEMLNRKTIN